MDRKVGIGYITTSSFNGETESFMLPTDESVCGILFDYSDFEEPFEQFPVIRQNFADGQTVLINNLTEADGYGLLDTSFMNGVPAYHITAYYHYIGTDAPLYICFTDDSKEWSAVEEMQMASGGKLFQIGIWTTKSIWSLEDGQLQFTDLIGNLQAAAETVSGKIGEQTIAPYPVSIMVCPNTAFDNDTLSIFGLPNATTLNSPKISVCLVQNDTSDIKRMQSNNPDGATVGCIGILLACLHLAYAEESIGYVAKFNLNKNDEFENPEVVLGSKEFHISDLQLGGSVASLKGYIMPCAYKGKEAETFFTGCPTCDDGDYSNIPNNRVMHKVRRAVHSALMPYIHSNHQINTSTGSLDASAATIITTAIGDMIDAVMVNADKQNQINGRQVTITSSDDILETDAIEISTSIAVVDTDQVINNQDIYEV